MVQKNIFNSNDYCSTHRETSKSQLTSDAFDSEIKEVRSSSLHSGFCKSIYIERNAFFSANMDFTRISFANFIFLCQKVEAL